MLQHDFALPFAEKRLEFVIPIHMTVQSKWLNIAVKVPGILGRVEMLLVSKLTRLKQLTGILAWNAEIAVV
jgi:hypothetical protein